MKHGEATQEKQAADDYEKQAIANRIERMMA